MVQLPVATVVLCYVVHHEESERAPTLWVCSNQGNLKGESVVAAILESCMEQKYCTSGFFVSKPIKQV